MKIKKTVAVIAISSAICLLGTALAGAAEGAPASAGKNRVTAEQKAVWKAAHAQYLEARKSYQASVAEARTAIAAAKAQFAIASAAAKSPEEKKSARQQLRAAIQGARSGIPPKPVRPSGR